MNLEGIIAVTGMPGLFRVISQGKGSVIVEDLITKKRMPMTSRYQANSLHDTGIYTYNDTIPLVELFQKIAIKEDAKPTIAYTSSDQELTNYFRSILEDYDEQRVYLSDIKKVFRWYNILQSAGLIVLQKEEETKEIQSKQPKKSSKKQ